MKKLHVISFDVPYPANYGGVIVVYHQLKALQEAGVKVTLHTYQYGDRGEQKHLEEICEKVYYYPRNTGWRASISSLPYIVNSRKSDQLLTRLLEDEYPIFFEGVHTTAWIHHAKLKERKKAIRMHNVEWQYYQSLHSLAKDPLRKYYFKIEAKRLKRYDKLAVLHANAVITISEKDQLHYQAFCEHCYMMPAPHGETYEPNEGVGKYYLYHGKLSVEDNERAAIHLIKNVFSKTKDQFIVAGMNPTEDLLQVASKIDNVSIVANPSHDEMRKLIKEAHANILYTFQDNGLKLKLLHALHIGRHCIVNEMMVSNASNLKELCHVGADDQGLVDLLNSLKKEPFTAKMAKQRQDILGRNYNNLKNTEKMLEFLKKHGFN